MSGSGHSLRTIPVPLPSDLGQQGLWSLPEIRTPSQSFFIKVTGKDEEGFRFQRLSSVSYTNIVPGKTTPPLLEPRQRSPHTSSISPVISDLYVFPPPVDPPAVTMPDVVRGFYMRPAVLSCSVQSDVPYRLRFTRGGVTLGDEKFFQ